MRNLRRLPSALPLALLASFVASSMIVAVSGCRTVPMTGRKQVMLTSEAKEIAMGEAAYRDLLAKETLSTNADAVAMVERVGQRIAAVAGRDDYNWEFKLIAGPTKNAFCLPGGKVAIYEGILPVCGSEAGLAVVMSHEIGHALARHGGERMNQQAMVSGGKVVGQMIGKTFFPDKVDSLDDRTKELVAAAYGGVSKYGVVLPFSRKHESEADAIGLQLMAKCGYDPSEAPHFWDRFSQVSGPKPPAFFSTHPSDARRASDLREQLPEVMVVYNASNVKYGLGDAIPEIQLAAHESTADQPVKSAAATEPPAQN